MISDQPMVGSGSVVRVVWSRMLHVVENFRRVFVDSRRECYGFVEFGLYLLKCSLLLS